MSAHEAPAIPASDQPSGPDHSAEMEEIERLKRELGDRVGMLRDDRPRGALRILRRERLAVGAAAGAAALAAGLLARRARR